MAYCGKCLHEEVCATAKACDGHVPRCKHFMDKDEHPKLKHGRWIQLGIADYLCSLCGFRFTSGDPIAMFPHCRCGAKMDGDGNAELKPCLCGNARLVFDVYRPDYRRRDLFTMRLYGFVGNPEWHVACPRCGAYSPAARTKDGAIDRWNKMISVPTEERIE